MIKFIKERDPDNKFDVTRVTFETDAETLTDVLEEFRLFLGACGYCVKDHELVLESMNESQH